MYEIYFLGFFIAVFIGIIAAVMGIGGGALNVPVLVLLFGLDQRIAVATSVAVIIFTSFSASVSFLRQGMILYKSAALLLVPAVICAVIASYLTGLVSKHILTLAFSVLLGFIAIRMLNPLFPSVFTIRTGPSFSEECRDYSGKKVFCRLYYANNIAWGAFAGFVNGFTGVGGGIINVPALVTSGVPIHFAAATSSIVIFFSCLAATATHLHFGSVDVILVIIFASGSALGAAFGAKIAGKIPSEHLKVGFGTFLLIVSVAMFSKVFL